MGAMYKYMPCKHASKMNTNNGKTDGKKDRI